MNLKQLHHKVMAGKTDYIPLMITIHREGGAWTSNWEATHNPQKYLDETLHRRTLEIDFPTDRAIVLESNFQETLIPSMYGAIPLEMPGGNIDVKPIINSIHEAEALEIDHAPLEAAAQHVKYLKANAPSSVNVSITRFMAPLDYAVVMRGGDFYLDLCEEPEKSMAFLNKIADATLYAIKYLSAAVNHDYREYMTSNSRGIYIKGMRFSCDAWANLSPQMIEVVCIPLLRRLHDELGGVFTHYCTTPFPAWHVLPTLAKHPGVVDGVDNWQGYRSFFDKDGNGLLQDKVSMCFDMPIDEVEDIDRLMQLPIFRDVKRDGGRGIFLATQTYDLERAKRLYDRWREYFDKK